MHQPGGQRCWLASGVRYEPDYSSRGAISLPRLAQSCPVVKVLSQKVANEEAKPAAPASSEHCCHFRSPGTGLWVLCATCIPHAVPSATGEPYSSSTYALQTKSRGGPSPLERSWATLLGLGLPLAGGCPATQESFPRAVGLEVRLSRLLLLLPEGASLNHSQNLTHLSAQIHMLFSEPKHQHRKKPPPYFLFGL